uniref:Uncharacterized protein n=1 Tax=Rhipicephalus zambeziensis TaxID=60191 RepID=A0A224YEV4_9ACAR
MFVLSAAKSIMWNMLSRSLVTDIFFPHFDCVTCAYSLMCSLVPHLCVLEHLWPSHLQIIVAVKRKCSTCSCLHVLQDRAKFIFLFILPCQLTVWKCMYYNEKDAYALLALECCMPTSCLGPLVGIPLMRD